MIAKKWFWSIITIYLILGTYIFYESFQSPTVGLEVEVKDDHWIVSGFRYPELKEIHPINQGDVILKINNIDIHHSVKLRYDRLISFATNMTVMTNDGKVHNIKFSNQDLPLKFFENYILPLIYFLTALILAIYLYINQKGNKQSLNFLILFILTIAIACGSIPLYIRYNWLGLIINSISTVLSPILLLSFLKNYYNTLAIRWKFFNVIKYLYIIPCIVFILTILEKFFPVMFAIDTLIILFLLFLLVILNIIVIITGYVKFPKTQIKVIFWGIVFPFLPFLLLYIIPPMLFSQKYIFSSFGLSMFFLFITFGITFVQFTERLFDIEYYISRLKYYSLFALTMTLGIVLVVYFFVSISVQKLLYLSIFIFAFILISFYIKEKLDYFNRKVLFTPRGNYIHQLYSSIESIGKTVTIKELFQKLTTILSKQLEFDVVYVIDFHIKDKQFINNQMKQTKTLHTSLDPLLFDQLQLMEIKKTDFCYVACIHQDVETKQILILGDRKQSSLKHEELIALELLFLFVNNFIDNTKLVEELLSKLNSMEKKDQGHPYWFDKLVLLKLEDEKSHLAQDLHDSILQEQIFLIREMDTVLYETNIEKLQVKLTDFHQQLVSMNHQLRSYCELLKPPLLDTLGLNAALNKLFLQTKKRAKFTLIYSIEEIETTNKYVPLFIYRTIQELLNNAIKHSEATYVKIDLTQYAEGFEILYMDNGVGFDKDILHHSTSMGLKGIIERVRTFNGYLEIDTYPNEGMQIQIRVGVV